MECENKVCVYEQDVKCSGYSVRNVLFAFCFYLLRLLFPYLPNTLWDACLLLQWRRRNGPALIREPQNDTPSRKPL